MKHKQQIVKEVCCECGKVFDLGYNGVYQDSATEADEQDPICDNCAGVERDSDGNAWFPDDLEITWEDGTVTTREEAFSK